VKTPIDAATELAISTLTKHAPQTNTLASAFKEAGFKLALVGGPVRDAILGRLGNDLDFTTNANPKDCEKILNKWADSVWDVGAAFGTIAGKKGEVTVEITTYRSESYKADSRKPVVEFGDNIEADLARRDFTINAMALELTTEKPTFIDLFNGISDLQNKLIKTPGKPEDSFSDDPLRMMRAARFMSQLDFTVDLAVIAAMKSMAKRLEIISSERIREEFIKTVMGQKPKLGITLLVETGLADIFLPEVPKLKLEIDEHHHHKDVYEHSLTVLEQAIALEERLGGPNLTLRLAALLHDIGKPKTRQLIAGGGVSFHHHEVVGARMCKERLRTLRFDNHLINNVAKLVFLHLRFHGYSSGEWSDSAVRRYVRDAGELLTHLHLLTRADCTTRNKKKADLLAKTYDELEDRIVVLMQQEELNKIRPDLTGEQIMQILNLKPSPAVGKAYDFLLELRLENGPMGEEKAKQELLNWWQQQKI
jgi:poly(A) polymerase